MAESRIHYRRGASAPLQELFVRVNGSSATYLLNSVKISRVVFRELDDLLLDLLDIAATVASADGTVTRGGKTRSDMGEKWHREFRFEIAVRRPEFWLRPEIRLALSDCVGFMTDELMAFDFRLGDNWPKSQAYLDYDPADVVPMQVDDVVLFSGGLDSFAGALQLLSETDRKVALVTHRSAPKLRKHQEALASALRAKFPGRVLHVAVEAHRVGKSADETTQRTRSFLFGALGYTLARCLGAKSIRFYENGIVSHNLPISPQVIGTMATRTTHPLTFAKLRNFLDLLGHVPIETPFEWKTKAEILEIIRQYGGAAWIKNSVSCTRVIEQEILHTHCGTCSQCLDRRFAILATGMEDFDPAEMYRTDVLFGAREAVVSRTMALEWTRHALGLVNADKITFFNRFGNEIGRVIDGHDGLMEHVVLDEMWEMHRRHGAHVQAALDAAIHAHSSWLLDRDGPPTSLLKLIVGSQDIVVPDLQFSAAASPTIATEPETDDAFEADVPRSSDRLEVSFWMRRKRPVITVTGLGRVEGAPAAVAHDLLPYYQDDLTRLAPAAEYRFVPGGILAKCRGAAKTAVAKNVQRCREQLTDFYRGIYGREPIQPLLIQSRMQHGYRLDPDCRVVDVQFNEIATKA